MLPQLAFSKGCIITLATSGYFSPLCIPLRHTHIGCICITCLHYVLSVVWFSKGMRSDIDCICLISHHCVFSSVSLNRLDFWWHDHTTDCISLSFLKFTLPALVWFFFIVCSQVLPWLACSKGCIITLATSVYFSPLCIPLRHTHIGCICITCLHYVWSVVWFFSSLSFQMCLQALCPIGYKVTLVTHMSQKEENSQLLHLFDFSSLSVLKCFLNLPSPKDA